jgi:CheY-like chemotaxis protein
VEIVWDAGFVAYQASNADDAMVLLEKHPNIRVLLTDIEMPGSMDGLKLAYAVRDRWPPIIVLIVSGRDSLAEAELPPDSLSLPKPYVPAVLTSTLERVASRISA